MTGDDAAKRLRQFEKVWRDNLRTYDGAGPDGRIDKVITKEEMIHGLLDVLANDPCIARTRLKTLESDEKFKSGVKQGVELEIYARGGKDESVIDRMVGAEKHSALKNGLPFDEKQLRDSFAEQRRQYLQFAEKEGYILQGVPTLDEVMSGLRQRADKETDKACDPRTM